MDFLKYKNYKIPAVLAITGEEQRKGLMFETNLPPVMAFVYPRPQFNYFWMKNVSEPLDIVFILENKIAAIHKGEPYSTQLIGGHTLSDLVLEFPLGDCEKLGMQVGDKIGMEYQPKTLSKILLS